MGPSTPYHLPRPGDIDVDLLFKKMAALVADGAIVFPRWTCPRCGERVLADVPNTIHASGYVHTQRQDGSPCGMLYTGRLYGMAVVFPLGGYNGHAPTVAGPS